jgi:glycosyltransferase involved in cell wall biosynthesis
MLSGPPLVSVVMPVYHADEYLPEAIESIMNQKFRDFEFIIICDDPSEKTKEIIDKYQNTDKRINAIYQKREGLVASLNKGFSMARGKYIARMDADDISLPQRFEGQVKFLENHQDIGICGTGILMKYHFINKKWLYPSDDASIKAKLLFSSPFAHPTIMIRRDILSKVEIVYDPEYKHAEDYELWVRCSEFTRFANLKIPLLVYRLNKSNISRIFQKEQRENSYRIQLSLLKKFGPLFTLDQLNIHSSMIFQNFEKSKISVENIESWLMTLKEINEKQHLYPTIAFNKILAEQWYEVCCCTTNLGQWNWKKFWESPLVQYLSLSSRRKFKFFIACLIRRATN